MPSLCPLTVRFACWVSRYITASETVSATPADTIRQQPQHRAPVGQQQEPDDHAQGGVQQGGVDTLEYLELVGRAGGGPPMYTLSPGSPCGGGLQVGDEAAQVAVVAEVRANDGLERLVIAGDHRRGDPPGHRGQRREVARVSVGLRMSASVTPPGRTLDHQGGVEVLRLEEVLLVQFLGGFRDDGR